MRAAIFAISKDNVFGVDNSLPWHSKKDFQHFKETTHGGTVVMGRSTWDSLPIKPLPGRRNVVLSRSPFTSSLADPVSSLQEAEQITKKDEKVFYIGGKGILESVISSWMVDWVFMTVINTEVLNTIPINSNVVLFKAIDLLNNGYWTITNKRVDDECTFITYRRIP